MITTTLPYARTGGCASSLRRLVASGRIKPTCTRYRSEVRYRHRCPCRPSSSFTSSASPSHDDDGTTTSAPFVSPLSTTLALSVHFRHPSLGMKDYEILSRATAFLLSVDPPESNVEATTGGGDKYGTPAPHPPPSSSSFPHLRENMNLRNELLRKQDYRYDPASGPRRLPHQLNWLEFCPPAFRPRVHVVASSHVVSPWMWPKYYDQDWLRVVGSEHVRYSLEVWGGVGGDGGLRDDNIAHDGKLRGEYRPLAKFALSPYPLHHPGGMDLALIHLKDEDEALRLMTKMGISSLHLPSMHELEESPDEPIFVPGERVVFQGFEVHEANMADRENFIEKEDGATTDGADDGRVFHPYSSLGVLAMASPDRFLARTEAGPLPEGLCGGPAIKLPSATASNDNGTTGDDPLIVRGVVEGIVPTNHESRELAGLASFLPSYRVREFVDYAERIMLERIIDKDLFGKVVDLKEKKGRGGTAFRTGRGSMVHEFDVDEIDANDNVEDDKDEDELPDDPALQACLEGTSEESDTPRIDREYHEIIASLRKNHTPEEVDAILATVEREREEVIKIMENEGGDMDDVIKAVRRKTYDQKDQILEEIEKEMMAQKQAKGDIESSKDSNIS